MANKNSNELRMRALTASKKLKDHGFLTFAHVLKVRYPELNEERNSRRLHQVSVGRVLDVDLTEKLEALAEELCTHEVKQSA